MKFNQQYQKILGDNGLVHNESNVITVAASKAVK